MVSFVNFDIDVASQTFYNHLSTQISCLAHPFNVKYIYEINLCSVHITYVYIVDS